MKFNLFMTLLEFVPEGIRLGMNGMVLGDYSGKELFWIDSEVQNMEVKVIEINHLTKRVILEVVK